VRKRGEPRWRQQRLRPDQGGAFAGAVGAKVPEGSGDLFARVERERPELIPLIEYRPILDCVVILRGNGIVVDPETIEECRRRCAPKQWVRQDCGGGHRPDPVSRSCARCGDSMLEARR
jgi:hypothetical protein